MKVKMFPQIESLSAGRHDAFDGKKYFKIFLLSLIFLSGFLLCQNAQAADWYVDNAAAGSNNGTSWTNAWPSFASIVWVSIQPGDTINISGGAESKTYNERLVVGASGTENSPVTIQVGQDAGHNGVVIVDGSSTGNYSGISLSAKNYVKISGKVGDSKNIKIQNWYYSGITISNGSMYFDLGYMEIANNGTSKGSAHTHGIRIDGAIVDYYGEIRNCSVHDNWLQQIFVGVPSGENKAATGYGRLLIHHNELYNSTNDLLECSVGGVDIYNNIFHSQRAQDGSPGYLDGMQLYNIYYRIFNNKFYDLIRDDNASGNAYIRWGGFNDYLTNLSDVGYMQLYNNLGYETRTPYAGSVFRGFEFAFTAVNVETVHDILVANNTMTGVPFFGLALAFNSTTGSSDVSNIVIANNIFTDMSQNSGIFLFYAGDTADPMNYGSYGSGADVIVDNNIIHASSAPYTTSVSYKGTFYNYANFVAVSGVQASGFSSDPLLEPDYRLNVNSSAINAGVNLSSYFAADILGNTRTNWSIGAYEYIPGSEDIIPPTAPSGLAVS